MFKLHPDIDHKMFQNKQRFRFFDRQFFMIFSKKIYIKKYNNDCTYSK